MTVSLLFLSLYPFICKYGLFPVGHPEILTEGFDELSATHQPYCGLIKAKILPPRNLFFPLLPLRSKEGKLCFTLCRACTNETDVDIRDRVNCQHTDEERALDGVWVSLEVTKALQLGYKVMITREVWNYKDWLEYDGKDEGTGLFVG